MSMNSSGSTLVLVERICRCGCNRKWRCLPTSNSFYAASNHARMHLFKEAIAENRAKTHTYQTHWPDRDIVMNKAKEMYSAGLLSRQISISLNSMGLVNSKGMPFTTEQVERVLLREKRKKRKEGISE